MIALKSRLRAADAAHVTHVIGKITPASLPDPGPSRSTMRVDRRQAPRWATDSAARVYEVAGAGFGTRHDLRVVDVSLDGLGAQSQSVCPIGTVVRLDSMLPGLSGRNGTVVRCQPSGNGYSLAIAFERARAA